MNSLIKRIVKNTVKSILNEEVLKPGMEFKLPFPGERGGRMLANKYGVSPDDFEYVAAGKFIYKPKNKPRRPKAEKPKEYLGRKEGETEQDYLERVRELNKKFADTEKEIEGEQWRPVVNTGRYRSGNTDYTRSHEVSNMGRLRTLDYEDPMRSRISTGYDAPTRKARQFHLDAKTADGEWEKTTPPVHTMVADAWLDAPEGNIEDYDVEHIDGNYHNNRADNLRYVLRKGRRTRNNQTQDSLAENKQYKTRTNMKRTIRLKESELRRMISESVRKILKENVSYLSKVDAKEIPPTGVNRWWVIDFYKKSKQNEHLAQYVAFSNEEARNIIDKWKEEHVDWVYAGYYCYYKDGEVYNPNFDCCAWSYIDNY